MAGELERRGDNDVVVVRSIDAPEDALLDVVAEFAVEHDLEADRSDSGEGLLLRPRRVQTAEATHVFVGRDSMRVIVTPNADGHCLVRVEAVMDDLNARGEAWKQRMRIRGAMFSVGFAVLGVVSLRNGFGVGDVTMFGLSGWFGTRAARRVRGEADSREAILRDVHNTLERMLDRIGYDD